MEWSNGGNECGFTCNENYTYDENSKTCVADEKDTEGKCPEELPENAEAVITTLHQTWNGTAWMPERGEWKTE